MIHVLPFIIRDYQQRGQEWAHDDIKHDKDDRLNVRVDDVHAVSEDEDDDVRNDQHEGGDDKE